MAFDLLIRNRSLFPSLSLSLSFFLSVHWSTVTQCVV
jgi:hypothetical protein